MRAMVMERIGGPLVVREVPDPVPPAGGVVVEVRATGLCRSDWHAWSSVMIAKALGARVIAVDRNPGPLDLARALGADHALLSAGRGVPDQVHAISDGGSHVAIDAVGFDKAAPAGMTIIGPRRP